MEKVSAEDTQHLVAQEAIKGGLFGLTLSGATAYLFHRYQGTFREIPLAFKVQVVTISTLLCSFLSADSALSTYPKSRAPIHLSPTSIYPYPLDTLPTSTRDKRLNQYEISQLEKQLSTQRKMSWAERVWDNRIKVLGAGYILGMAGTGWLIHRRAPKEPLHLVLMESRLFAHGWTLAALCGLAYLVLPETKHRLEQEKHSH